MPTLNELLAIAIAELSNLQEREVFLVHDLFKGYNGTEYLVVIACSLAPCYSIILKQII
jgi:hypothetical protein